MAKNLAVLDFDHTVVDGNTDTIVADLLEKSVRNSVRDLYQKDGWTAYMQAIFELLHKNNIQQQQITTTINNIPAVNGFPNLIKQLNEQFNYDVIIISDSNSYFIDSWLESNQLKKHILNTFTNPAKFENGLLKIEMFHLQDYCTLSTKNLCKGQIMDDFKEEQRQRNVVYAKTVYIGDGNNDFCPILRLKECDLACVRENFKCAELVKLAQEGQSFDKSGVPHKIRADVVVWKDGEDIFNALNNSD